MPRQRQSRSGYAPAKRLTAWGLGPGADTAADSNRTAISTPSVTIIGSGITPLIPGLTLIRMRGMVEYALVAASAAQDSIVYGFGIGMTEVEAFTAGAGSVPSPITDAEWPGWLFVDYGTMSTSVGALAVGDPSENPRRVEIDTKAMRKFRLNSVVFAVVEAGEVGTCIMDVTVIVRMLNKLP